MANYSYLDEYIETNKPRIRLFSGRVKVLGFDSATHMRLITRLIDGYNDMLPSLETALDRFRYVDLRPQINPELDWANELHLKNSAYARAAEAIDQEIRAICAG